MNPLYHPVTPDDTPIPPPTSPAPVDVFMELESLNSSTVSQNESSQNQESSNASPSNLPSLKEARKVAIIIGVVIFLGIGYVARFTLTIDETLSVGYHMIFGYVHICWLKMAPLLNKYYQNRVTLSGDKMP